MDARLILTMVLAFILIFAVAAVACATGDTGPPPAVMTVAAMPDGGWLVPILGVLVTLAAFGVALPGCGQSFYVEMIRRQRSGTTEHERGLCTPTPGRQSARIRLNRSPVFSVAVGTA